MMNIPVEYLVIQDGFQGIVGTNIKSSISENVIPFYLNVIRTNMYILIWNTILTTIYFIIFVVFYIIIFYSYEKII